MKVVRVAYNKDTKFIIDIIEKFEEYFYLEKYNLNNRKESKIVRSIQTELGSKNLPLIAIQDENLDLIGAIWSENKPNWEEEIIKHIKSW